MDYHAPNPVWERDSRRRMTFPSLTLTTDQRLVVDRAIREHCLFKGWEPIEVNCRTNHVHVIVEAPGVTPERVMTELKGYGTRALRRNGWADLKKAWTEHGSTRYINSEESLQAAIRYVRSQ
jgi:REP element-mobilizing transposase RayT